MVALACSTKGAAPYCPGGFTILVQDLGNCEKDKRRHAETCSSGPQPCPGPSLWAWQEEVMPWVAAGLGLRT